MCKESELDSTLNAVAVDSLEILYRRDDVILDEIILYRAQGVVASWLVMISDKHTKLASFGHSRLDIVCVEVNDRAFMSRKTGCTLKQGGPKHWTRAVLDERWDEEESACHFESAGSLWNVETLARDATVAKN